MTAEHLNLSAEAQRQALARTRAFAGTIHVDYFPRLACPVCGAVPWLDKMHRATTNGGVDIVERVREEHDARKHGVVDEDGNARTGVQTPHRSLQPIGARIRQAADRLRAASGERDDDD